MKQLIRRIGILTLSLLPFLMFGSSDVLADGMGSMQMPAPDTRHLTRSEHQYQIPDVTLRDRNDQPVALQALLGEDRPIVLQFIFTSCQTVCPMLTAMTAQAQDQLRTTADDTLILSISLDPEYDTPQRMAAYASKFGARGHWMFLTGDWKDIQATLTAFDAMYPGHNKMYHKPLTFMRAASSKTWVRLSGLMGSARMIAQFRQTLGMNKSDTNLADSHSR